MICYKDKTYCGYYKFCQDGNLCHRALTPEVRAAAIVWMGKDAPICVYWERPDCYREVKDGDIKREGKV